MTVPCKQAPIYEVHWSAAPLQNWPVLRVRLSQACFAYGVNVAVFVRQAVVTAQ